MLRMIPGGSLNAATAWVESHVLAIAGWAERRPPAMWRALAFAVVILLSTKALFDSSIVIDGQRYFWLDDDQMISMRYARNLARGHGAVWNPGEFVEGYTNPLWTLIMAGVHLLPIDDAHTSVVMRGI